MAVSADAFLDQYTPQAAPASAPPEPAPGLSADDYLNQFKPADDGKDKVKGFGTLDAGPSASEKLLTMLNAPFSGLANSGVNAAMGLGQILGGKDNSEKISNAKNILDQQNAEAMTDNTPAKIGFGAGEMAGNAAQFMGAAGPLEAATKGLSAIPKIGETLADYLPQAGAGALTGATQPAQNNDDRISNIEWGAGGGAAGKLAGNILGTQVTDPERATIMQTAKDFNIPVYRSQVAEATGGKPDLTSALGSFLKEIPGTGAGGKISEQTAAFNRAVNSTMGVTGDAVSPETLTAADTKIGQVYDTMKSKYNMVVDKPFLSKLTNIRQDIDDNLVDSQHAAALKQVNNVFKKVVNNASGQKSSGTGTITGEQYQNLRSNISGIMRGQNGSPQMGQLLNTLDAQFAKGMAPGDAAQFQQARGQYRNMLAVAKVVGNAPNEAISPAKLQGAVKNVFGNYAWSGGSDLERLARLGNVLKDNYPNSGTATRNQLWEAAKHVGGPAVTLGLTGAGGYEGEKEGGTFGALAGGAASLALARYGITPYLFSKMSRDPSIAAALMPALGATAPFSLGGGASR